MKCIGACDLPVAPTCSLLSERAGHFDPDLDLQITVHRQHPLPARLTTYEPVRKGRNAVGEWQCQSLIGRGSARTCSSSIPSTSLLSCSSAKARPFTIWGADRDDADGGTNRGGGEVGALPRAAGPHPRPHGASQSVRSTAVGESRSSTLLPAHPPTNTTSRSAVRLSVAPFCKGRSLGATVAIDATWVRGCGSGCGCVHESRENEFKRWMQGIWGL